jgi:hypothetical protein
MLFSFEEPKEDPKSIPYFHFPLEALKRRR